ncbi:MAG: amino acid adenylation domain-containing protein [Acidobacteriota bacterium]
MRILLTMNLPYYPTFGGANKGNRILAEGLAENGHQVQVVVPVLGVPSRLTHTEFIAQLTAEGIEVSSHDKIVYFHMNGVEVQAVADPSQLRTHLVAEIEKFKPDCVLVSSEDPSHNLLDAALKACPDRVIYLVHTVSFLPFGPQAFFPSESRAKLIEQVAGIATISKYTAQYLERWGGLSSKVIYWPWYGSGPFPNFGRFDQGFVTMLNPCEVKGISILLALAQALPEVQFAAVPTWGAVAADLANLKSLPNMHLLSPSPNIDDILSQTRILLVPSLWEESFGLIAVEAMLRGIPVLASNIGGLVEAKLGTDFLLPVQPIEHFSEQLNESMIPIPIVPKQDITPWREALSQLLSQQELYEQQSKTVRETAIKFVSSLTLEPLEELIEQAINRSGKEQMDIDMQNQTLLSIVESLGEDFDNIDDLSPEQQALLMLWLREKAAEQVSDEPHTQSIQPIIRTGELPLSFAQQRLWFLNQLEPNSAVYNIPSAIRLSGKLDLAVLQQCFNEVVDRHEVLRTNFDTVDGKPVLVVASQLKLPLPIVDLQQTSYQQQQFEINRLAIAEAHKPFDLAKQPLLRMVLLQLGKEDFVLLLTMHHIVSDAWSIGVFVNEVIALYEAFSQSKPSPLQELPIQYVDFAGWQREWLQGEELARQLDYWKEQLAGSATILQLPTDRPRPAIISYQGASQTVRIPQDLTRAIKELCQQEGVTLFMTLLAAFETLLFRYSEQKDIIVGSPIANRNRAEIEPLIGFFVNTLVFRTDFSNNPSFLTLLQQVRQTALDAYSHQDLPFEKLVEELHPQRNLNQSPLFQVMFMLQNASVGSVEIANLNVRPIEIDMQTTIFDLSLALEETPRGLVGIVEFSTELFDLATIDRMIGHWQVLLEAIVANPTQSVRMLPILTTTERHQLLVDWNSAKSDYPKEKCIHELFQAQVERTPDAVAIVFNDEELTYKELDIKANQLAHYLRSLGVSSEKLVGIYLERSLEMVIGLLGILKAGGGYLPLDIDYPQERLAYMLGDTKPVALLTQRKLIDGLPQYSAPLVCIDDDWELIEQQNKEVLVSEVSSENLIYIIYTSGSTGEPKGVMVNHQSVCNSLYSLQKIHKLVVEDRLILKSPLIFDASAWELFWPLSIGASVVIARPEDHRDSRYLAELIATKKVTTALFVPSLFQLFLDEPSLDNCHSLKKVICGGEALSKASMDRYYQRLSGELHNCYGPTETSIGSINWPCVKDYHRANVPIGRPLSNIQIYLLDSLLQPVPIGVAGELYTGGDAVARGYLNHPDLTATRFIPDPFSNKPGARLYRTGDLARYLPDGNIEFLGRTDQQVKIRGFRVELSEIETNLSEHTAVREALVLTNEDKGEKHLVAYIIPENGQAPSIGELRSFLKQRLPNYMVPSDFVFLEEFPIIVNGKIDRAALPIIGRTRPALEARFVAASNSIEEIIAGIWAEVLVLDRVGVVDNFFDLGGHSLLAIQVASRLRAVFPVEISVRSLFESPTIAELAEKIEAACQGSDRLLQMPLQPVTRDVQLPLSFAQQRLWFLDQLQPNDISYNIPAAVKLEGKLNIKALAESFNEIVRRHEVLRTTFQVLEGTPFQSIFAEFNLNLPVTDLSSLFGSEQQLQVERLITEEAQQPFNLAQGPLIRIKLLKLNEQEHVLLLTMHHIVADGWSMNVLIQELTILYRALSKGEIPALPELPIQYGDFAYWQRQWLQGEVLDTQLNYWQQQLHNTPPLLSLPTDRPRPVKQTYSGTTRPFELSVELHNGLRALSRKEGTTLFMTLLAAFQTLLYRYTGQPDIVVGTPIANRSRVELEGLIGFFVNTLVLRAELSEKLSFQQLLKQERKVALEAYAHQDLPFEKLVEVLQPERDMGHLPLCQVMFALQNMPASIMQLPDLTLKLLTTDIGIAKFDLTVFIIETDQQLKGSLEYNTDLFDDVTIARMLGQFQTLLENIITNPTQQLATLPILTPAEEEQLLISWNNTDTNYPQHYCLHQLFEAQVERTPDAIAVVFQDQVLTYQELNRRANQLGHYLRKLGVEREVLVGICLERSVEMIVGMLGILKAGGAYLPLDPSYPKDRLDFMIRDAGVTVLVTEEQLGRSLNQPAIKTVLLDVDWAIIAAESNTNIVSDTDSDNLAYAIYTSGSTGEPKGILITHRAVSRLIFNTNYITLSQTDRVAQASNASFDAATFEIWGALTQGARLVGLTKEIMLSPLEVARQLKEQEISVLFLTTALFNTIACQAAWAFGSLQHLLFGGELVEPKWVQAVLENSPPARLLHVYGPTESTTFACWHLINEVKEGRTIPIGRPISNTQAYILDNSLQPVPVGVIGEVYLGGDGLARGYLNRPALTAERFIANPFSSKPGERLYKTGDLARYLPDGSIEFIGRTDNQVKIRGFRIELGEIEAVIAQHPDIDQVIVIAHEDLPGEKRLVAYLTAKADLTADQLSDFLKQRLPEYMLPSAFIILDRLPLNANGKIDRRLLPSPDEDRLRSKESYLPPRDNLEFQLVRIWEEILNISPIGVRDSFFDLGGHSLLAVRLMFQIKKLSGLDMPLTTLFQATTIEKMALLLRQQESVISASALVIIQPRGSKRPFFCVHPAGGNVLCYVNLARHLGLDQPFYGLQARGLNAAAEPDTNIKDMAACYIEAIRTVQPHGPYLLGGWSMGGLVAFEMAQQLRKQNEEVAKIVLFDTWSPIYNKEPQYYSETEMMIWFIKRMQPHALDNLPILLDEQVAELGPEELLERIFELAKTADQLPTDFSLSQLRRLANVYKVNSYAAWNYLPEVCDSPITIFRATQMSESLSEELKNAGAISDLSLGWQNFARGILDIKTISCTHEEMMLEPQIGLLAAELERCFDEIASLL